MAFPPRFLEELRSRVPLAAVVARRVKLVRKGREYHGLCPFHNEKTPSFTVNEDKGFYHCFGCGAHGDAIGFEMQAGRLSFTEAVEKLAAEAGLEVPAASPEERRVEARRASLHDAMEAACAFFERQLKTAGGRPGLAYLQDRGLTPETIARFRLGWAPDSREALKTGLMSDTLPEALLVEAGLLKKPDGGGAPFDMFRGRVTFPITDRRGRVIAFGARTLGDGQPKYLNSPETPLFHKGATLYGLAHAREAARSQGRVVAVEGYMDVIALHQAGFAYAVAPLGTALTEQQIGELWRLADEPTLCFDGDSAGQRAMARAAERGLPLCTPGKSLRFAVLPHPEDPDSLIKAKGPQAMQAVLDAAKPLVEVVWDLAVAGRPLDTPERRAALEKEVKDKAFAIADETVRRQYWDTFRDKLFHLGRAPRTVRAPAGGATFGAARPRRGWKAPELGPMRGPDGKLPGQGRVTMPEANAAPAERRLLALLIIHPPLVEQVAERLGEIAFSDSELDNLRRGILKHLDTARDLDEGALCAHLRSDGFSRELDSLLDANEYTIARPDAVRDAKAVWDHVFTLYSRKDLLAAAGQAAEAVARDTSDANWNRQAAVLTSHVNSVDIEDEGAAAVPPGPSH
jgi:DNA primase